MNLLAKRRARTKRREASWAWYGRDRDIRWVRSNLDGFASDQTSRYQQVQLSRVNRVELMPLFETVAPAPRIVGDAYIHTDHIHLTKSGNPWPLVMSWAFDTCSDVRVSENDHMVMFRTGRDDGSELVGLRTQDDSVGWRTRVAWTCHRDGVQAAIDLVDEMLTEHRHKRPTDYFAWWDKH